MSEQWRPHPKYPVSASNRGRVRRNLDRKILPQSANSKGYLRVTVPGVGLRYTHIVVIESFKGLNPGKQCRHLNGDKTCNYPLNLKWGTAVQNLADAIRHGTHSPPPASGYGNKGGQKYGPEIYDRARSLVRLGLTIPQAALKVGVSRRQLFDVLRRKHA